MFNLQNASQSPITMSSQDIAELTGKRHDNVWRTIESLIKTGVIRSPQIEVFEKINNLGLPAQVKSYMFRGEDGKRDSIVVVAQLSPEFTAKLVDRWQELEQQQHKLPTDYLSALKALTAEVEERQKLEQTLSIAAPKAQFVDSYVESEGSFGFREVAKILGVGEKILRSYLLGNDIMYRLKGNLTGRAYHSNMGRFITKTGTNESGNAFSQTKFTPKGVYWIAKKMNIDVDNLPEAV